MDELSLAQPTPQASATLHQRLRSEFSSLGVSKILGARLGELLNRILAPNSFKDWLVGTEVPNLAAFAELHLGGVVLKTGQRQGSDFLYEVCNAQAVEQARLHGTLWKSFSAVTPSRKIAYLPRTSELQIFTLEAELPEGFRLIHPISIDEHRTICISFADKLASDGRAIPMLKDIAANYSVTSYHAWTGVLRANDSELFGEWGLFRLQKIRELFRSRLERFGIGAERVAQLVIYLEEDQQVSRRPKNAASFMSGSSLAISSNPNATACTSEMQAREVLRQAIDSMSLDQLKRVQLPFDVVLTLLARASH